jgi:hypothetical protein
MQPQLFLAAEYVSGATQGAVMNIVKHSPSPSGCHFIKWICNDGDRLHRAARLVNARAGNFFARRVRVGKKPLTDSFQASAA